MYEPEMFEQEPQPYATGNRSLLNAARQLASDKGLIIVLGNGNSRIVLLESIEELGRALDSYTISFASDEDNFDPNTNGKWVRKFLPNSKETADNIRELKKDSQTCKEYLVTKDKLTTFHNDFNMASKEENIINGDQDDHINSALELIDIKSIIFGQRQSSCCTLS